MATLERVACVEWPLREKPVVTLHVQQSPLIGTPLLPRNSALIREVSFGEREHHMHSQSLLPTICILSTGVSSLESARPLREGPLTVFHFISDALQPFQGYCSHLSNALNMAIANSLKFL